MSRSLHRLLNLGGVSVRWLLAAGIADEDALRQLGPVNAFRKVETAGFQPSLNLLYALAGALEETKWNQLPRQRRSELLRELDAARDIAAVDADGGCPADRRLRNEPRRRS